MIADNINASATTFRDVVWPRIAAMLGGGELIRVEGGSEDRMRQLLDVLAGIDCWRIAGESGMQGLASRVSVVKRDGPLFNTFTLRYTVESGLPTEFQKRVVALENDEYLLAKWTIHAYVSEGGDLVSAGVIDTRDLCRVARDQEMLLRSSREDPARFVTLNKNPKDKSTFLALAWEELLQQPDVAMTVLKLRVPPASYRVRCLAAQGRR